MHSSTSFSVNPFRMLDKMKAFLIVMVSSGGLRGQCNLSRKVELMPRRVGVCESWQAYFINLNVFCPLNTTTTTLPGVLKDAVVWLGMQTRLREPLRQKLQRLGVGNSGAKTTWHFSGKCL
jgi:hypothetical protein